MNQQSNEKFKFNLLTIKTTRDAFNAIKLDSVSEISFKGNFQHETINITLGNYEIEGGKENEKKSELDTKRKVEDSSIIIISGQDEKIPHSKQNTDFNWWNGLKEDEKPSHSKPAIPLDKIEKDNAPGFYEENYKLGTKYKNKLGLNTQEVAWLNKFYIPDNVFLSIEGCCVATIRLYLMTLKELNKKLKKNNTTIIQEVNKLKVAIINAPQTWYTESEEADIFLTIFKRAENAVRTCYQHKRKIDEGFNNKAFSSQFELLFGNNVYEILMQQRQFIIPPDKETLIELNAQNTIRWKEEFEQICLNAANNPDDTIRRIYELREENIKNPSIENIFYEAAKEIAKYNREEAVKLYLHYIYYNLKSTKADNKALPKIIQNALFSNDKELEEFQKVAATLNKYKNLTNAIQSVSKIYTTEKKKIHLDLDLINEVKLQHSETVEILGQVLADEDDTKVIIPKKISDDKIPIQKKIILDLDIINQVKLQHSGTVEILGQILDEEEKVEAARTVNQQSNDILSIGYTKPNNSTSSDYIKSLPLNENQVALLNIFKAKELKMSSKEIDSFAKNCNVFRSQLIDSINENCYELLDDILIEEMESEYLINADYFNKIVQNG